MSAPDPDPDEPNAELFALADALGALLAAERTAIGALDHAALAALLPAKQQIVERLATLHPTGPDRALRDRFARLRVEAHATALLAGHAHRAVDALLGREPRGYDRRANYMVGASSILRARAG